MKAGKWEADGDGSGMARRRGNGSRCAVVTHYDGDVWGWRAHARPPDNATGVSLTKARAMAAADAALLAMGVEVGP